MSGNNVNSNCSELVHLRSSAVCLEPVQTVANLQGSLGSAGKCCMVTDLNFSVSEID